MTRILIVVIAATMAMAPGEIWAGLKTGPYEAAGEGPAREDVRRAEASPLDSARGALSDSRRAASAARLLQDTDTVAAARALVPLLRGVRQRMRPRLGVGPGSPPDSPFTGTQTTVFSIGIGKKDVPIDPKVAAAIDQLSAWKIGPADESPEAVLFSHWLEQLSAEAVFIGIHDCDAACVVARFTKPDAAFGKSRAEREATRDELLLEALAAAVSEVEPRR